MAKTFEHVLSRAMKHASKIELYSQADGRINAIVYWRNKPESHVPVANFGDVHEFMYIMQDIKLFVQMHNGDALFDNPDGVQVYGLPIMLDGLTSLLVNRQVWRNWYDTSE